MPSKLPKIVARTDEKTINKFKVIASKNQRSVSQETVYLVKQAIEQYEKENGVIQIDSDNE